VPCFYWRTLYMCSICNRCSDSDFVFLSCCLFVATVECQYLAVIMHFAAVDVWSVGVIFLSLLAGHYPIFKASDDMEALSQIICVFGSEELKNAAQSYGNFVTLMNFGFLAQND